MSRIHRFVPTAIDMEALESRQLTAGVPLPAPSAPPSPPAEISVNLDMKSHQQLMLARSFGAGTIQQSNIGSAAGQMINHVYPVIGLGRPISVHNDFNDMIFLVIL